MLDANELTQALSAMGLPCSQEYIQDMLKQYDKNRDGTISFSEVRSVRSTMHRQYIHGTCRTSEAGLCVRKGLMHGQEREISSL